MAFDDRTFPEGWYQQLLFEHPSLIPVEDIEQAFGPLIPLAREMRVGGGKVDIAYISPDGFITLVETKLWRNPDARRDVVAQIIEYATGMAKWSYADLCNEVRRIRRGSVGQLTDSRPIERDEDPILPLVRDEPDFNETRFVDSVTTNLRKGRFLLLIVGDGIQEGVEELARTMQASPHLGFTLALVETAVYRMGVGSTDFLVQPRVLARTREIVRHVIEINNSLPGVTVTVKAPDGIEPARIVGITEAAFFEQVEKNAGKPAADFAKWFVAEVDRTPQLRLSWSREGPALRWDDENSGKQASLLRLRRSGELSGTNGLPSYCARNGVTMSIADRFQDGLVQLLHDATRVERGGEGYTHVMARGGGWTLFAPLAGKREAFWKLVMDTTNALALAQTQQADQPSD